MDTELLEEILACPSLPSLPAVAVRVIELTQDPQLSLDDLAETIQNDQGLSAKILRTVNSSFYGVRRKCTTISSALVMLGLSTVKSLALGFSLVSALRCKGDGFDTQAYWRRGLFTAVAAKIIAREAGKEFEDEAFLGGLLQDIGVIAMYQALGPRYTGILRSVGGDHRRLMAAEIAALEIGHGDIGAMMATRWKLPEELVVPIKYHERATASPAWCADRVRCVAAGNLVHDVLTDADPGPALARLMNRADEWFGLDRPAVRQIVERVGKSTREMASLFVIETGPGADAERVLALAAEQAAALAAAPPTPDPKPGAWDGGGMDGLVRDSQTIDPITGVLRRRLFDTVVRGAFDSAAQQRRAMSILQINIDGFRAMAAGRGIEAADEVLVASARLLRAHFDPIGGVVCRWAEDTFAVAIQGKSQGEILRAASDFRTAIERASQGWKAGPDARPLAVTASIGAANFEAASGGFQRGEQLIAGALRAVEASRASGGNCVRTFVPKIAA